jgi:hypothetical protein
MSCAVVVRATRSIGCARLPQLAAAGNQKYGCARVSFAVSPRQVLTRKVTQSKHPVFNEKQVSLSPSLAVGYSQSQIVCTFFQVRTEAMADARDVGAAEQSLANKEGDLLEGFSSIPQIDKAWISSSKEGMQSHTLDSKPLRDV